MFQQAFTDVLSRLETAKFKGFVEAFALIGGFAVPAWGVPRATRNIDFATAIDSANPHSLTPLQMVGTFFSGGSLAVGNHARSYAIYHMTHEDLHDD